MDDGLIRRLFSNYSVAPRVLHLPQKGYRNTSYPATLKNGQMVNLIIYKSEPGILARIRRANYVADYAAQAGLPIRHTLDQRIIRLKTPTRTAYGALYGYLPGQTIPWEAYTKAHIKLVGMAMSALHARLQGSDPVAHAVVDEYRAIVERMRLYFESQDVRKAMKQKLQLIPHIPSRRFDGILAICATLPHQQNLHMDFVRGNLLFDKAHPTSRFAIGDLALGGIIDFEKVAYGHPVFDVARTLAFLLVDCPVKSPEKIQKYFLQSGYNKRGEAKFALPGIPFHGGRLDLLEELTTMFLVYDFYKFLRHNPYESLNENHHFIRTRDILIQRKMLQYS
jgi:Ser/Thr protein kinase RdoA (MazF antagonist)